MRSLTSRQQSILNRVIDTYIETAEPIGSRTVTASYRQNYHASFSPATVRSEMNLLEDIGYLTHPHISSGRVPTDLGYRYYVNHCLLPEEPPRAVFDDLFRRNPDWSGELEFSAEKVPVLLARVSGEVGILLLPECYGGTRSTQVRVPIFVQGLSRLFAKPEFQDVRKVRLLVEIFEDKIKLSRWLVDRALGEDHPVVIGCENRPEELRDCSLVLNSFPLPGGKPGVVAVLGPRRMRYGRALPLVSRMAEMLSDYWSEKNDE